MLITDRMTESKKNVAFATVEEETGELTLSNNRNKSKVNNNILFVSMRRFFEFETEF